MKAACWTESYSVQLHGNNVDFMNIGTYSSDIMYIFLRIPPRRLSYARIWSYTRPSWATCGPDFHPWLFNSCSKHTSDSTTFSFPHTMLVPKPCRFMANIISIITYEGSSKSFQKFYILFTFFVLFLKYTFCIYFIMIIMYLLLFSFRAETLSRTLIWGVKIF